MVTAVSDLTKYDFEKVFKMEALEFFAMVSYISFRNERDKRRLKAINKNVII